MGEQAYKVLFLADDKGNKVRLPDNTKGFYYILYDQTDMVIIIID